MNFGKLDRRVTLRSKSTTKNGFGEDVVTWVDIATVWAEWISKAGTERWGSQRFIDTADGALRIRYLAGLDALDEVLFDGAQYRVLGQPEEVGRRRELLIQVQRLVG